MFALVLGYLKAGPNSMLEELMSSEYAYNIQVLHVSRSYLNLSFLFKD